MVESGGAGPADSYIGSLISLTSKSEIRYEGLLYTVDTENSNIALQNVQSFGTEGRKKNGPQIPASDKVYEFIIFRGTDIKDLQVKMSPPPPIHSDPAIISLQAQVSQSASVPPVSPYISPPVTDLSGNQSTYKANSVPYYHTASSGVPLWAPPPPSPVPSGGMPYYWQGFYRPQDEHRLLEPLGLDSTPISARGLPISAISGTQPSSAPSEQYQASTQASTMANSYHLPLGSIAASHVELVHPARGGLGASVPVSNAHSSSLSFTNLETSVSLQVTSDVDVPLLKPDKAKEKPSNKVRSGGSSGASHPSIPSAPQTFRKATGKSQVYKQVYRQVQATKDTFNTGQRGTAPKSQPISGQPLLPLPSSPVQRRPLFQQEAVSKSNSMRRGGRGMGRASRTALPRPKLLEDFDFIAMNEKFNKEEVWDELLKVEYKGRVTEEGGALQGLDCSFETKEIKEDFDRSLSEFSKKAVYVKDDFFDSLSCDALGREHGKQERPKFAEQRRIDAETFGSYHIRNYRGGSSRGRHRGGGGHGQARGGGRGQRGYGYSGLRGLWKS
ncbi:hypothetical protein L7F22_048938 [Adiantum nelumboides]|nr:hypothetical protein [Adiantum nelumboides]